MCAVVIPPLTIYDVTFLFQNKKFCDFVDKQTGYKTKCMLTFPMIAEKECIGVVMALNKIGEASFSAEDEAVRIHIHTFNLLCELWNRIRT